LKERIPQPTPSPRLNGAPLPHCTQRIRHLNRSQKSTGFRKSKRPIPNDRPNSTSVAPQYNISMAATKKKMTLEKLAELVSRGFGKNDKRFDTIETKLDAVFEETGTLMEDMTAVKSDLSAVKSIATSDSDHLVSIESEIKGIRADAVVANKRISTPSRPAGAPAPNPRSSRTQLRSEPT
jgi:hypothetical protein